MSDQISYNISFNPSPTPITLSITVQNNELSASVSAVPDVGLSLSPTGGFGEKIMSQILQPIANLIKNAVNPKPSSMLQGKSFMIGKVPAFATANLSVSAQGLALGAATLAGVQYVKATATLTVVALPAAGSQT